MKYILSFLRFFVGIFFLFSGVIKLIDPLGFAYKLDEYFSDSVFSIEFLQNYSLFLSLLFSFFESLLGLFLILGIFRKSTLASLLILVLFFSFLTFYSAYFDKVKDCGCFGEAILLDPWVSFGKNVFLLFCILILFLNKKYIYQKFLPKKDLFFILVIVSLILWIPFYGLNHLPIIDFRPYKVGKSISEQMKTAQKLAIKTSEYQLFYVLKNKITAEKKTFSAEKYLEKEIWKDSNWEIQENETFEKKIKGGYSSPIIDFRIEKENKDITDEVLESEFILLVIAYDFSKSDPKAVENLHTWFPKDSFPTIPILGLCAGLPDQSLNFINWAFVDSTVLKTMIRSNPGFILLKKGVVVKKWHWKDRPKSKELEKIMKG